MNLWHLAIFNAVAESGSISAGAKRLHLSQPAVTRQLRQLESLLGSTFFDRLPRGVRLTESGELLHDYAQRIFTLEREAETAIREMRQLGTGELVIGASSTIGNYLLPPMLAEFRRRYPAVEITVEIANAHTIETDLLSRRLALGLTEGRLKSADLHAQVFMHDEIIPIAAATHPLAHLRRVGIHAICRETLLQREAGSGTREFVEEALKHARLQFSHSVCLGSTEAIKNGGSRWWRGAFIMFSGESRIAGWHAKNLGRTGTAFKPTAALGAFAPPAFTAVSSGIPGIAAQFFARNPGLMLCNTTDRANNNRTALPHADFSQSASGW